MLFAAIFSSYECENSKYFYHLICKTAKAGARKSIQILHGRNNSLGIQQEILKAMNSRLHVESAQVNHLSNFLFIGELADRLRVNPKTIRYYEREGLIKPTRHGKFRTYFSGDVDRLKVVLEMRKLGVSIANIKALYELDEGTGNKKEIQKILNEHLNTLTKQLKTTEEQMSMTRQVIDDFAKAALISL
jgi:DNA-binding transcriptional MerR regulator